ncbi:50S ribosomal protein L27 [Candidatus Peribacteria bacterium RIFCSPLOWO2_12_FULL_55_15]|nr:MAG: 50S ribosomal protein L27 [Candidatus Peribacteria bacterium RIFCSPHIGHO2_01_FULL_54_22]OGJ65208.1 MAG: 50S ribosomal protein L27 [Candidatus Peribacteria bacterium RIFCSPHIGHO2_12_FULL_54_10]OGJ67440.1 MAG: 50S ribosomal protein L27 [Candidatus Peribacteria bacterium RIFCSPLOWO2_01_FULL_54_110]OGJ69719.1 MAG: 50S ribosomal protein L27 [Candidatus Peribacteria bacterium RIFCSPLOWO2_02_FULL_55_36]OGJ70357.1 MAG: 50S ribosomal protein L27 [Candidatus Peribacteria bacterium RIFCSPLOWO2_12_
MAHKKAGGTTTNGRDSRAKRRGVKRFGGQVVQAGEVLLRQKGLRFHSGPYTYIGRDGTIHAALSGTVTFMKRKLPNFHGCNRRCTIVTIAPAH